MNFNNFKFLILLLISSLASANLEKRGIKPRKGADLPTEDLNKTEIVSSSTTTTTTIKPTPPKINVVEPNKTHMGREGVMEPKKKLQSAKNTSSSEIDSASINKQKNPEKNNVTKLKSTTTLPSKMLDKNKNLNATNIEGTAKNMPSIVKNITSAPKVKSTLIPSPVTTTIKTTMATTTTSTTTTTTTTTKTTPEPKKPKFAFSVEDNPSIENVAQTQKLKDNLNKQLIDEPMVQSSRERDSNNFYDRRHDYFIAIISMIFILPIVMGLLIVAYRKFNEFWSTRHYRRMDFLIEGMYD